jgi:hypothetical protein
MGVGGEDHSNLYVSSHRQHPAGTIAQVGRKNQRKTEQRAAPDGRRHKGHGAFSVGNQAALA